VTKTDECLVWWENFSRTREIELVIAGGDLEMVREWLKTRPPPNPPTVMEESEKSEEIVPEPPKSRKYQFDHLPD
jgi:hypothetical protein